jgi:hypothetical protein
MASAEIVAWVALGLAVVLGVLVAVQTVRLGRIERRYRALMRGAGPTSVAMSLGEVISGQGEQIEQNRASITALNAQAASIEERLNRSVQHVGLVRYNPFQDTGGDQSFAIALLDRHGDGVVFSSLHNRSLTRIYAKPIKSGASAMSLSEEEVQAVQQALGSRQASRATSSMPAAGASTGPA